MYKFKTAFGSLFQFRRAHTSHVLDREKNSWKNYTILIFPAIAFSLGAWQTKRLFWKKALIEEREAKLSLPSIDVTHTDFSSITSSGELGLRKISCEGRFLNDESLLLGPRTHSDTPGNLLITPFQRDDGSTILVNRGFVPRDYSIPKGESQKVRVEGVIREKKTKGYWTPQNSPARDQWFWTDIDQMALSRSTLPVMIDVTEQTLKGQYPYSEPLQPLPNNHLNYLLTWYTLGFALSGLSWKFLKRV
eukprot:TRINITY_DN9609_c0_g1_i1.p1 TRINITY_DN9609_c0_g1~~TRINITY_DN9609_c0_g1_i1.p1  ORF type:complete len:248 (-),score=42.50 TRINITY_DN9609_c0_g1_i1:35-778(-)